MPVVLDGGEGEGVVLGGAALLEAPGLPPADAGGDAMPMPDDGMLFGTGLHAIDLVDQAPPLA